MFIITLPDSSQRSYPSPVSVYDVAADIGPGLASDALAGKVDGMLFDLSHVIESDAELSIATSKSEEGLEIIRHSTAHLMAQAVKILFPEVQVTIGPVIENGFYYDFSHERPFTPQDLDAIEKKMSSLVAEDAIVVRRELGRDDAVSYFLSLGEKFKAEIIELSDGDVAGIKSATVRVVGAYAYGWLRTETGVHRLVRKSPFDSGSRRHTSFASIFISPELDDDIDIELDMSDVRVDTYRASGAGGQHVNKTDSAIRLTHQPSGLVVQCQSQRSQHKNKDQAIKQLKAKLYELEAQRRKSELQVIEDNKSDISWGSQIRSYVLDSARIKDLRTNVETSNTQAVLNGDLDFFIEASLKQGL